MQKIGAHVSAAKGVSNAPINAHKEECETFQFFISSPHSYTMNEISDEEIKKFKDNCKEYGFTDYYVHAPYLINLASTNNRIRHGSITLLRKGLEACSKLGVKGMMFHTGSGSGHDSKKEAITQTVEAINKILDGYTGSTKLLIENAAGAGSTIGVRFDEIGSMLKGVKNKKQIGVCLDTQHAFASGYDWRTKKGTNEALKEFTAKIGIKNLVVVQVNDSKVDCGTNKDRHEHITQGHIGLGGFKHLLNHAALKNQSFILETEPDGRAEDITLLKSIRKK